MSEFKPLITPSMDIYEIKCKEPIKGEEEFHTLFLPGQAGNPNCAFSLSSENTWEGEWIYRAYNFGLIEWRQIPREMFEGIIDNMKRIARMEEIGDYEGSKSGFIHLNNQWKRLFTK